MPYDLRHQPWIPWRRASGAVQWGPPATLLTQLDDDPVVALAAPRPDFDGAVQELLIGLLTVALQPEDEAAWRDWWRNPPRAEELQEALDALPAAFYLDGDGPRFFQDLSAGDFANVEPGAVDQLLIDAPGDQGIRLNKDLFVKRARVECLGRPAAAMALVTLQTYAPAGGRGNRTSLRGGGPLTTLVDPRVAGQRRSRAEDQPLWRRLWANVETREQLAERTPPGAPDGPESIFPWLAPTRTSGREDGLETTPADAHPAQAYFGLPRRIRLEFGADGCCDLTGLPDQRVVVGFRMRPYGVQYARWRHPLSPYYRPKASDAWLPVHGQPGGVGWRDWVALTVRAPEGGLREPAAAVAAFARRGASVGLGDYRLHAVGYDMDNMKARGWTEALLPAFAIADPDRQSLLLNTAAALTDVAGMAASALLGAVKRALFPRPDDAPGDLGEVKLELWNSTASAFYARIGSVADPALSLAAAIAGAEAGRQSFAAELLDQATAIFDRWCPAAGLGPEAMRRRVAARYDLISTLRGYSPLGEKLFTALGIPLPGGGRAARKSRKDTRKDREATT